MRIERKHWPYLGIALLFLALITLPYVIATLRGDNLFVFGGFLFNPIDGNSYLAKMHQGWNGSWQVTLPYTAEPGEGSYLFLFYLFLGQISRITGLSILLTFHLTRVLGAITLLRTLYIFFKSFFDDPRWRLLAFTLSVFGSGFGWIAVFFGAFTPDFWVAEAFPFLSAYATPHFAFGLALQITLLNPALFQKLDWPKGLILGGLALSLAIIMPFGAVVVGVMWLGIFVWQLIAREDISNTFWRLFAIGLGSGPLSVYYLWIARVHPILAGWNAQNLTPSPPLWELLIALSPALLLAIPGLWAAWQRRSANERILFVWLILGFVLLYAPFNLQRRFISAFYVPVAMLAVIGLAWLVEQRERLKKPLVVGLLLFSMLTNLIVLLSGVGAIIESDLSIYLWREELAAHHWLEENTPPGSIILAQPQHSLGIPVYSDNRVIYGHPFETVNAEENEALVNAFFSGEVSLEEVNTTLESAQVNFILFGPISPRSIQEPKFEQSGEIVYSSGSFTIYQLP